METDMLQRFKFYNLVQGENERAKGFILKVKLQAESCAFSVFKDTAIRDKLAMGVFDKNTQQKLLEEEDLTLAKTEKIIVNREVAGVRTRLLSDGRLSVIANVESRDRRVYSSAFSPHGKAPYRYATIS